MSIILNIRGANGAGKSTIAFNLLKQFSFSPVLTPTTGKVVAYKLDTAPDTYLLGRYETACGGVDTVPSFADLRGIVAAFADKGNVVFEGSLFSTVFKGACELASSLPQHHFIFASLNTPLEVCIQRVVERRKRAGNFAPFDPAGVEQKYGAVLSSASRLEAAGFEVVSLPYEDPLPVVLGKLGIGETAAVTACSGPSRIYTAPNATPPVAQPNADEEELMFQIGKLNRRFKKIAGDQGDTQRWSMPSNSTWLALLEWVPFIVLYEDVLRRLYAYRSSVRSTAAAYMEMIVSRNGHEFTKARGLKRPKPVDIDDISDDYIPQYVSKRAKSA